MTQHEVRSIDERLADVGVEGDAATRERTRGGAT